MKQKQILYITVKESRPEQTEISNRTQDFEAINFHFYRDEFPYDKLQKDIS